MGQNIHLATYQIAFRSKYSDSMAGQRSFIYGSSTSNIVSFSLGDGNLSVSSHCQAWYHALSGAYNILLPRFHILFHQVSVAVLPQAEQLALQLLFALNWVCSNLCFVVNMWQDLRKGTLLTILRKMSYTVVHVPTQLLFIIPMSGIIISLYKLKPAQWNYHINSTKIYRMYTTV